MKKAVLILVALLVMGVFVSCNKVETPDPESTPVDESSTVDETQSGKFDVTLHYPIAESIEIADRMGGVPFEFEHVREDVTAVSISCNYGGFTDVDGVTKSEVVIPMFVGNKTNLPITINYQFGEDDYGKITDWITISFKNENGEELFVKEFSVEDKGERYEIYGIEQTKEPA